MAQGDTLLEEIIVTARKREENVLEIPESLTTFTGDMVESANINGLEDIGLLVPNLWMSKRLDGLPQRLYPRPGCIRQYPGGRVLPG